MITVKLFASLQKYLPEGAAGRQAVLDVGENATVGDVLDGLGVPRATAHLILVNGQNREWETPLVNGDTLTVFPPVAGG